MCVVLHGRKLLHGPGFSDGEGTIGILPGFVQLDSACVSHGYHDDSGLLVVRSGTRWGRGLGVAAIFLDADVGDVGLLDWRVLACTTAYRARRQGLVPTGTGLQMETYAGLNHPSWRSSSR
jgi:hypothetical protein